MSATLNTGWILTVLRSRGLPLPEAAILRSAIVGLDQSLIARIGNSLKSLEKGGGDGSEMDTVAMLGRCLNERIHSGLLSAGVHHNPSSLLEWCMTQSDAFMKVRKAIDGLSPELEEVKTAIGIVEEFQENHQEEAVRQLNDEKSMVYEEGKKHPNESVIAKKEKRSKKDPQEVRKSSYAPAAQGLRKHHVYGKSGAILVEIDIARASEGEDRQFTLRIEGAQSVSRQVYNWEEKIIFQLTRRELHQAAAVFLGLTESCEFKGHGDSQEKWLTMKAQQGGVFLKVGQDKRAVAVPVGIEDLYEIGLLSVKTLCMNDPDLDQSTIVDVLRLSSRLGSRQ